MKIDVEYKGLEMVTKLVIPFGALFCVCGRITSVEELGCSNAEIDEFEG